MADLIQQERDHRQELWKTLLREGGPLGVPPALLRQLRIYGGAQGVWVDKQRTAPLSEAGHGVTVGLLHTGSSYADDLDDDGVIYHYPRTARPPGRDRGEIEATKAAQRCGLPVFVITYPSPGSTRRNVHLGWVEQWDDAARMFLITFGDSPPPPAPTSVADDAPFSLVDKQQKSRREVSTRQGQHRFKFQVFQRYGTVCAVCGLQVPALLDAAHLRPKTDDGSDDPRNGLVLCPVHHRALDGGLFGIEPTTLQIRVTEDGPDRATLRITHDSLAHLEKTPHPEALQWLWRRWTQASCPLRPAPRGKAA